MRFQRVPDGLSSSRMPRSASPLRMASAAAKSLTAEMRGYDKRYPVNFMKHPQVTAVMSRMRKDVTDAFGADPYPASYANYTQTEKTLIIYSVQTTGFTQTVIWDFQEPGVAEREFDADPRAILSRLYLSADSPRAAPQITDPKRAAGGWIGRLGAKRLARSRRSSLATIGGQSSPGTPCCCIPSALLHWWP